MLSQRDITAQILRYKKIWFFFFFTGVLFIYLSSTAQGASQQTEYTKAIKAFQKLKDSDSSGRRDLWLKLHDDLKKALKMGPGTGYAPRILYYMGRTYEELVMRSGLKKDARMAVDYFQRAVNRFAPGSSWIDDCLYRKAEINFIRLKDSYAARKDLEHILKYYPKGDQAANAKRLLAKIEKDPKGTVQKTPTSKKSTARDTEKYKAEYSKAVDELRALRRSSSPARQALATVAEKFESLYENFGSSGTYAARSAYFAGMSWAELGHHTKQKQHLDKARKAYTQAVDTFSHKDSWRDDAMYGRAFLDYTAGRNQDQVYADLLQIVRAYPKGDMAPKADKLLSKMDKEQAAMPPKPVQGDDVPTTAGLKGSTSFGENTGEAVLTGLRYASGEDFTRVVLDLTNGVKFKEKTLPADPARGKWPRMFVDLEKTRLGPEVKNYTGIKSGFLKSVRTAQNTPSTTRVVLDFEKGQRYHILVLDNPYRMVIDVFAKKKGVRGVPAEGALPPPSGLPAQKPDKAAQKNAQDVLAQLGMTIKTIMIDPGHGGRDPGALHYVSYKDKKGKWRKSIKTKEKDVTLRLAKMLGEALKKQGYKVLYTRTTDKKVALEDRAMKANIQKADLFISLHCNANNSSKVNGFETYYLGRAKSSLVLKLAAKENNVDPVQVSDTQKIVLDLVQSFKLEESKSLARHIQKQSVQSIRRNYGKVTDHKARPAPFFVLIGARMPAVLVEIGYLSHKTEAKRLRSEKYLNAVANGIIKGIEAYKKDLQTTSLK